MRFCCISRRLSNNIFNEYILNIDEIESIREHYEMVLRQGGFATLQAKDGLEALAMVEANPVDLVVLDLRMPKLSGKEFISQIRGNPAKKKTPPPTPPPTPTP